VGQALPSIGCLVVVSFIFGLESIAHPESPRLLPRLSVPGSTPSRTTFSGEKSFSEAELRAAQAEALAEIDDKGVTPARADDLAFYVGVFYRKAGFSKVAVDYQISGNTLRIVIIEGPRTLIAGVSFVGNQSIPDATLYDYMIGASPDLLVREPEKFPYTAADAAAGADRVHGLYLSQGFLESTVDVGAPQFSAHDTRAKLTVRIHEGPRFTIGEVSFEGPVLYPRADLVAALGQPVAGPFAPGVADSMRRNLESYFKAHGYYQAAVTVTADPKSADHGRVALAFHIRPQGLFRFDSVSVRNETGHPRLNPHFLPQRFAALKGRVYDPEKLALRYRELLHTGLFESLRVSPRAVSGQEVAIDIAALEAKARELGFTLGAGSYEGASAGLRLGDRDLFGNGRPLSFSADYSQRGLRGEVLYLDPWLFDSAFALRARFFSEARNEMGYSKNRYGGRLEVSRKMLPRLDLGAFVEAAEGTVKSTGIAPDLLGPPHYRIETIGVTQISDFRNDPINPRRGFVVDTAFDGSTVNGQPSFLRSTGRISYYLPVGKALLAFGARGGLISATAHDLPIDVRFFNGGATTVRSFAERELGPKDRHTNPIGGDRFSVFNVEYTLPIKSGFEAAIFGDAGSLHNPDDPDHNAMRYAIGAGIRYKLPIGPLRLDYGVNPDRRPDEAFGAFHFSFGAAF